MNILIEIIDYNENGEKILIESKSFLNVDSIYDSIIDEYTFNKLIEYNNKYDFSNYEEYDNDFHFAYINMNTNKIIRIENFLDSYMNL